jgi:uncharacterized integral membrane protein
MPARAGWALFRYNERQIIAGAAMRYLRPLFWLLKFALFAVLFGFAMHNADRVTLHFFLGYAWNLPLHVLLLAFFVLGAVFGLLACVSRMVKLRREVVRLRREVRNRSSRTRPVPPQTPPDAI